MKEIAAVAAVLFALAIAMSGNGLGMPDGGIRGNANGLVYVTADGPDGGLEVPEAGERNPNWRIISETVVPFDSELPANNTNQTDDDNETEDEDDNLKLHLIEGQTQTVRVKGVQYQIELLSVVDVNTINICINNDCDSVDEGVSRTLSGLSFLVLNVSFGNNTVNNTANSSADIVIDLDDDENGTVDKMNMSMERIADAREAIAELEMRLNTSSNTSANFSDKQESLAGHLLEKAKEKLEKAEEAFEEGDYGEAFGQATAARSLARNGLRALMRGGEPSVARIDIKTKVRNDEGMTRVKIRTDLVKEEFTMATTDREDILEEISRRTGLTVEELQQAIIKEETEVKIRIPGKPELSARGFSMAPGKKSLRIEEENDEGSVVMNVDAEGRVVVVVYGDDTLTIERGESTITIREGSVSAETEAELEWDGQSLLVQKGNRKGKVVVLPESASDSARTHALFFTVQDVKLDVSEDGKVVYTVKGVQKGKLLGLFDVELEGDADVDASSGTVVRINKPFWAALVF
ncbi:MAG: hypothetical protein HY367_03115 [Candidatus Aenigmarchaeota archaeon]|nr:hypothetical protein [Candidatus Aenigmarchaeota archaeon]